MSENFTKKDFNIDIKISKPFANLAQTEANPKKFGINLAITLVVMFFLNMLITYFWLVPTSFEYTSRWVYTFLMLFIGFVLFLALLGRSDGFNQDLEITEKYSSITAGVVVIIFGALLVIFLITALMGAVIFNASKYYSLIEDEIVNIEGDEVTNTFKNDFQIADSEIPVYDTGAIKRIANQQIGSYVDTSVFTLGDFNDISIDICNVPQLKVEFELEDYTCADGESINKLYGIAPISYSGFWKYNSHKDEGIEYAMLVNKATGYVTMYEFEEGMKYAPSAYFSKDLRRHVYRNGYKSDDIDYWTLEISDDGTVWWIGSQVTKTIGLRGGTDIQAVIKVNPFNGDIERLSVAEVTSDDSEYSWIDTVYPYELIEDQINYYGGLEDGYFNYLFAEKGVKTTTEGSRRVLYSDGSVYHFTSYTSINADTTSLASIFINSRTKEVQMYHMTGLVEEEAMRLGRDNVTGGNASTLEAAFPILYWNAKNSDISYYIPLKNENYIIKYSIISFDSGSALESGDFSTENIVTETNLVTVQSVDANGFAILNTRYDSDGNLIISFDRSSVDSENQDDVYNDDLLYAINFIVSASTVNDYNFLWNLESGQYSYFYNFRYNILTNEIIDINVEIVTAIE